MTYIHQEKIFAATFKGVKKVEDGDKEPMGVKDLRAKLMNELNEPSAFKNEWFVLYNLIAMHGQKITTFSTSFLRIYAHTNFAAFKSSPNVDITAMADCSDDEVEGFVDKVLTAYDQCMKIDITEDDFMSALLEYKMLYCKMEATTVLETASEILNEGKRVGNKQMYDFTDMKAYTYKELTKISNVMEKTKHRGCVVYGLNDEDDSDDKSAKEITKFYIPTLDSKVTIMEKDMVNIIAPSKCGKSRFTMNMAVKSCLDGVNVGVWSLENGFDGAEAMFRARLYAEHYYTSGTSQKFLKNFDDTLIKKKQLTGDLRDQELACWTAFKMRSSKGEVGKFCNIEEAFSFDTYLDVIERYTDLYDIKLWIIDYPGLITEGARGKNLKMNELMAKVYIETKQFINNKKIAVVFPAQFKQEWVEIMAKMKKEEIAKMDLRTVCGISFEVFKTADINICLYGSYTDIKNREEMLLYVPSRNFQPFDPIDLTLELGTCTFLERP